MFDSALVEQLLKQRYGKVKPGGAKYWRICCPTCSSRDSKKMKRYVSKRSLFTFCYICEQPLSLEELMRGAAGTVVPVKIREEEPKENPMARIMPGRRFIPVNQLPSDHPAIRFLAKDHLHELDRYSLEYGIVFCPSDAGQVFCQSPYITSAERLIFPVYFNRELVGWQMRSIPGTVYGDYPNQVKYYHLFPKGSYLFNYDNARKYDSVVLVEGVKKALKFCNGVAAFGKHLAPPQVQLMHAWKNIAIMLDAEESAQRLGMELTYGFRAAGINCININPGNYGLPSPDEGTKEQLFSILTEEWCAYFNRL